MIELNNIKNNQLNYLYDLNNDGKSDLIFLSETYSTPQYSTKRMPLQTQSRLKISMSDFPFCLLLILMVTEMKILCFLLFIKIVS